MASFIARTKALHLLNCYGFGGARMLELAPRLLEIKNLNVALEFWTKHLKLDTIDRHPDILYIRPSVYTEIFNNLTKVFANTDIAILLNNSPQLLLQNWEDVDEKIQFALTTVEARHKEIVHSQYLDYSLEHIRTRYNFLFRSGMYIKPHKKDRKRHYVVPLKLMVEAPHADVLKMTGLLASEYSTMQELTAKEIEYEKKNALTIPKRSRRHSSKPQEELSDDEDEFNVYNQRS